MWRKKKLQNISADTLSRNTIGDSYLICNAEIDFRCHWVVCTNIDSNLIADQHNLREKYLQDGEEN